MKRNAGMTNHKEVFWLFFPICCSSMSYFLALFITKSHFTYERFIHKVWTWHTDFLALCSWFALVYMRMRLRKICSAKVKQKKISKELKSDYFFLYSGWLNLDFIQGFPRLIFLVGVSFASYCYLHKCFEKNHKIVMLITFAL